jgi:hypothetical protein
VRQPRLIPTCHSRFFGDEEAANYQDDLIATIRKRSSIPLPYFLGEDVPYTEPWRRFGRSPTTFIALNKGWQAIVQSGKEREFLKGAKTEEDWADVMARVFAFGQALGEGFQGVRTSCGECEGQADTTAHKPSDTLNLT